MVQPVPVVGTPEDQVASLFTPGDINDPRVNPEMRRRIAIALMTRQRAAPKNVGEGFNAIGEAIGDKRMSDQLLSADAAMTQRATDATNGLYPPAPGGVPTPPPPQRTSYAPDPPVQTATLPPVQTAAVPPAPTARSLAQPPADPNALPPAEFGDGGGISQPGTTIPALGARSRAALILEAQRRGMMPPAPGVPPRNPTEAGAQAPAGDALAGGGDPSRGISRAPPGQIVRQPIPTTVQAEPDHVMAEPEPTPHPGRVPMSREEIQIINTMRKDPYNTVLHQNLAPYLKAAQDRRAAQQELLNKDYENAEAIRADRIKRRDAQLETQAKRRQDYQVQQQNIITPGTGGAPVQGYDARLGTDASPQRSGVPTIAPPPPGATPQDWMKEQVPRAAKAVEAVEKAKPQVNEMVKMIRQAREHPGKEWGVGTTGKIAQALPWTDAAGFGAIMKQIGGKNFLAAFEQLKGGGAVSEKEGEKAEAAQARLITAQTQKDFDDALRDLELSIREGLERAERKVNRPVTAWRPYDDNASTAPDIGQRRGDMEYVGGNPRDQMSWRRWR
jgi:hypothetical protein